MLPLTANAQNTLVHLDTPLGAISIELFDTVAPLTVANFLNYVNDGDYDRSFIHRSVPGFVIQGGGFKFENGTLSAVPTDPPVANEFSLSNVRGTIAMAKVSGNPNSATSQWFINLSDNSATLDSDNGGFTVFGKVVGNGMIVVDAIEELTIVNAGVPFDTLPVIDFTGPDVFEENLVFAEVSSRRFGDVAEDFWAHSFIEGLAASGITAGCGVALYCPENLVSRAQMAVFLERGIHGSDFVPPEPTRNLFLDVATSDFAAGFIEQLYLDGITSGCGGNKYCPDGPVTRAQMAVFLLRAKHGGAHMPPAPIGVFDDVSVSHWAAAWIEQLAAEGITSGCGNGNYCPDDPVTRAQMAVFLVKAFDL